jgi:beta-xylosidase
LVAILAGLVAPPAAAQAVPPPADPYAPLYPEDFPDPSVIRVGITTYAYATNGPHGNVQVIRSPDLRTWDRLPDALLSLPVWAATAPPS